MGFQLEYQRGGVSLTWEIPPGESTIGGGAGDRLRMSGLPEAALRLELQEGRLRFSASIPCQVEGVPHPPELLRVWLEGESLRLLSGETLRLRVPEETELRTSMRVRELLRQPSTGLLLCLTGLDAGKEWVLPERSCTLGRGMEADFQLRDRCISRLHARLERVGSGWRVEDLGSPNGVDLNGQRLIGSALLWDGAELKLGQTQLRFYLAVAKDLTVPLQEAPELSSELPQVEDVPLSPPAPDQAQATPIPPALLLARLALAAGAVGVGLALFSLW